MSSMRITPYLPLCTLLLLSSSHCASAGNSDGDDAGSGGGDDAGTHKKDASGSTGDDNPGDDNLGDDNLSPDSGSDDAGSTGDDVSTQPPGDDASSGDDAASPPGNCGTRSGMRGKTSRMVTVGGATRTYVAYLPASADATKPIPFVMVFHGFTMSGEDMYSITGYNTLADSEGIAVVFPDGQAGSPWNVSDNGAAVCGAGNAVNNPNAVDFAFMDAMKADIEQDQCLDSKHVFVTGFSMGGYFSHHVGCDRTDVRAIGPASGGTIADLSACKTGHVPVIMFHGTSDGLIASGCDDPNGTAQAGFPPAATLWAKKNGCGTTYTTTSNKGTTGTGQCYLYEGCPTDGQVELCTFTGMSHEWAGGSNATSAFGDPSYASATQLEWAFWKKYAW
jgi:polyhydroxybutyrate depolymerase